MRNRNRNYRKEYDSYHGKPEQIKRRGHRVQALRNMKKKHGAAALKGKDVDHKDRNPLNNAPSNLRILSRARNRANKG